MFKFDNFAHSLSPALESESEPRSSEPVLGSDLNLRRKIKRASQNVPRYLFRLWSGESGGGIGLNTTTEIKPRAFDFNRGHDSIFDMQRDDFTHKACYHLSYQKDPTFHTEFSSWTSSLKFALDLTRHPSYCTNLHIAMIDTEEIAETNTILHVPALVDSFPDIVDEFYDFKKFQHEYLIHGVIRPPGYTAIPLQDLMTRGLYQCYPRLAASSDPYQRVIGRQISSTFQERQVQEQQEREAFESMAKLYGPFFETAFFIAVYLIKNRPFPLGMDVVVDFITENFNVPDWSGSRGVLCENAYPPFQDNRQMLVLMYAVQDRLHGRGARGRAKGVGACGLPSIREG